jgi:hypothetical protein
MGSRHGCTSVRLLSTVASPPPRTTTQFARITRLRGCDSGSHYWIAECGQFDSTDGDGWSKDEGSVWELFDHVAVVVMAPHPRQARATALVNYKFWHVSSVARLGTKVFQTPEFGGVCTTPVRRDDWYVLWQRGEVANQLVIILIHQLDLGCDTEGSD